MKGDKLASDFLVFVVIQNCKTMMSGSTALSLTFLFFAFSVAQQVVDALPARILIYTATAGYRHDSIPTAVESLRTNGSSINLQFDNTEDKSAFNDKNLSAYDGVMFLSTTGEVLDEAGKDALSRFLKQGGNFIGVHSASDSLVNTSFFGHVLGAYFDYHPPDIQNAIVDVINNSFPFTSKLPKEWKVSDEIYNFKSDPRKLGAVVVLSADESSYVDNGERKYDQGTPHPIAWCQTSGGDDFAGRSFYTSLGHSSETWKDNLFLSHVFGGVLWALDGNTTLARNSSALVGNSA